MSRTKKIHQILPPEDWHYLEKLIEDKHPLLPKRAYFEKLEDMILIYKSGDRFYLSKWLEMFVIYYARTYIPNCIAKKVDNRGKAILNRQIGGKADGKVLGVMGYRKDANQILGEPDIRILCPKIGTVYFEVKIGNDRLSEVQKQFIDSGFGKVWIVKTVKDVISAMEELKKMVNK